MTDDNQIDINHVKDMMAQLLSHSFEIFGPTLDGITFSSIEDFIKHDMFLSAQQIYLKGREKFEKKREQIKLTHPQ